MLHHRLATAARACLLALLCAVVFSPALADPPAVTRWQYDVGNTGWDQFETLLKPAAINSTNFGKLWVRSVEGQVYAQPLYVPNVSITVNGVKAAHNVVYVATEHNSVYAFDADSADAPNDKPLWYVNVGPSVPSNVIGCGDLVPEVGITATPVIDTTTGTIYLAAKTLEADNQQHYRLHALDIATGQERAGWGFDMAGSVVNDSGHTIVFTPSLQLSRCGLALLDGYIYITIGSHCDINLSNYRGWIFSYATNPGNGKSPATPHALYCTSPNSNGDREAAAGLWMSGGAPAFDEKGNLYFISGNGLFDINTHGLLGGNPDVGDSFVKLSTRRTQGSVTTGGWLDFSASPADYFTPSNQAQLDSVDEDLGAGGNIVIPAQPGSNTPRLLAGGGKDALLRLLNRDNLGGYTGQNDGNAPNNVLQEVPGFGGGFWSLPAYYNGPNGPTIFAAGTYDVIKQYSLGLDGKGNSTLSYVASSPSSSGYPGSTPVISSDGTTAGSGIVWMLSRATNALHAFDASNIGTELWNSNQRGDRDGIGSGGVVKFTVPTISNGRVYVGGDGKLIAYGTNPPDLSSLDHFVIVGPTTANKGFPVHFQATAIDAGGNTITTSAALPIAIHRPDGSYLPVGTLRFAGQSSAVVPITFAVAGANQFVVGYRQHTQSAFSVNVLPSQPSGLDHFTVNIYHRVVGGQQFSYTLTARDKSNQPVAYTGSVPVGFTRPDGSIATDQPNVVFTGGTTATGTANLGIRGIRIAIANDGTHVGTGVTVCVDNVMLAGRVLPGDWIGHNRLHATIRLLDPANHKNVIQSSDVILGDDFSFAINVPLGSYDVAVQVEKHWLQQIRRFIRTDDSLNIAFNGPKNVGIVNGDANGDGIIDTKDIAAIKADLGGPASGNNGQTDLNGDGVVDQTDVNIATANLGARANL